MHEEEGPRIASGPSPVSEEVSLEPTRNGWKLVVIKDTGVDMLSPKGIQFEIDKSYAGAGPGTCYPTS